MTYLLDSNVLIALSAPEHADHAPMRGWAAGVRSFAVCPIVQGALVRHFLRFGRSLAQAQAVLRALAQRPGYEFWPDDLSYAEAALGDVRGHKQVTDAYLAALARAHGCRLATLDAALAALHPDVADLIP